MMQTFDWRRLTEASQVTYRLDADGRIYLQGDAASPPFLTARVRDGQGGFVDQDLGGFGVVWMQGGGEQGWELRTAGDPTTMAHLLARWGELVGPLAEAAGVDGRFVLVTIACETGNPKPDAGGLVKAPRTEKGYPDRRGEGDPGDQARDAADWSASRGQHSSHGLMQTLIGTAVAARPDLFAEIEPARYREVLWEPANSLAAGIAYLAHFGADVTADPIALRFAYGAGSVRPTTSNRWGAVLYDEIVPLKFIALWNDLACIQAGECKAALRPPSAEARASREKMWLAAGLALLGLSAAASTAFYLHARRVAA